MVKKNKKDMFPGFECDGYDELSPWDRTWIAIDFIDKMRAFIAWHIYITNKYGEIKYINGNRVYHLPCRTWQQFVRDYQVAEKCNLPRVIYMSCQWISPPPIIEDVLPEELKPFFKMNYNTDECRTCEDRELCFDVCGAKETGDLTWQK